MLTASALGRSRFSLSSELNACADFLKAAGTGNTKLNGFSSKRLTKVKSFKHVDIFRRALRTHLAECNSRARE
jgi:hypothetical protein